GRSSCFFFSSRRRHTRWPRDWSSDVCSSDLAALTGPFLQQQEQALRDQNRAYPFSFTPQPFQARLAISIPLWGNFQQPLQVSQRSEERRVGKECRSLWAAYQ